MSDQLDELIKNMRNTQKEDKQSDFWKIFQYYVSSEGIRGKTKITPKQRNMIYVYDLMHTKHPTWGLNGAAENLAQLLISQDGESRKGMIELFRGLLSQIRNESVSIETQKEAPK